MLEPVATDRMLEIGCGAGLHTLKLARLVGDVVGIDRAFAGVARAQANSDREATRNAAFAACDAAALPFANAVFDKIVAIDFVEHVNDDVLDTVLREARRVLRADGQIALYTPCATHYVEWLKERNFILRQIPGHVAVRSPEAYVRLLQRAGFTVPGVLVLAVGLSVARHAGPRARSGARCWPVVSLPYLHGGEQHAAMKLVIQIPCLDEAQTLAATLRDLPADCRESTRSRSS